MAEGSEHEQHVQDVDPAERPPEERRDPDLAGQSQSGASEHDRHVQDIAPAERPPEERRQDDADVAPPASAERPSVSGS
jgi:hypothetical protein